MKNTQVMKGLYPNFASKIPEASKYLDLSIWPFKDLRFSISLHICLASESLLKTYKSLKTSPPRDFVSPKKAHFLVNAYLLMHVPLPKLSH